METHKLLQLLSLSQLCSNDGGQKRLVTLIAILANDFLSISEHLFRKPPGHAGPRLNYRGQNT